MSTGRRVGLACLVVLSVLVVACGGDPPDKEMQQAQAAIDAARAASADRYALEEFTAAQGSLKQAHDAVGERDYRLALSSALDSRERAENAAKQAAATEATARKTAARALTVADAALTDLRARLKARESGARAQSRGTARVRATVADAEAAVQKARTALNEGDYLAATDTLNGTIASLRAAARELGTPAAPSARRRR